MLLRSLEIEKIHLHEAATRQYSSIGIVEAMAPINFFRGVSCPPLHVALVHIYARLKDTTRTRVAERQQ